MTDPTEEVRRDEASRINADPAGREALEAEYGHVWDTQQLAQDFMVIGFLAPFVVVRRKSDRVLGSLAFQDHPRFYFDLRTDRPLREVGRSSDFCRTDL